MYGIIPQGDGLIGRWRGDDDPVGTNHITIIGSLIDIVALCFCFAVVTFLSCLWRDRLDGHCVTLALWVEQVALGKKSIGTSALSLVERGIKSSMGNGVEHKDIQVVKEKHDLEHGAKA